MSSRMRINVKFGETKVLVPVGEGNITVEELISKAIEKFRKVKKLVSARSLSHSISATTEVAHNVFKLTA